MKTKQDKSICRNCNHHRLNVSKEETYCSNYKLDLYDGKIYIADRMKGLEPDCKGFTPKKIKG